MLPNPTTFLNQIFKELQQAKIDVSNLYLDHICYRVESMEGYQALKSELNIHQLLTESQINGRPIATFLLKEPFTYKNRNIYCLELPAPKKQSHYKEGYEHVEFVIKESFMDFMQRNAHLKFDTKGMKKAINADIRLPFNNCSVKFHHFPLEHVVRYLD